MGAVPGVDTARRFGIGRTGCAAPNVQTAVAGYVGLGVMVRDLLLVGLVPRPTFTESGLGCAALVSESRHQVASHRVPGASQPCRLVGSLGRAVPHPPGSRRRAPWGESGVRSGQFGNRCRRRCGGAPGGAEQADAADEGRLKAGGIIVVGHSASGCHRGRGQGRAPLAADPQCSADPMARRESASE